MSFDLRPFAPQDADWLVARHAALYARDDGFDDSFGPLVAGILADFMAEPNQTRQAGWIAWAGAQRLGSIFCVGEDPATPDIAKLRLFLVEPQGSFNFIMVIRMMVVQLYLKQELLAQTIQP